MKDEADMSAVFKTQGIIVISSSLKASIKAVIKKTYVVPKIPLRKIQRKRNPTIEHGLFLITPVCEWVIGLHNWNTTCSILFTGPEQLNIITVVQAGFVNTVENTNWKTYLTSFMHKTNIESHFKWHTKKQNTHFYFA